MKKVNISDIKVEFGNGNSPKDEVLIKLLVKGYKGEVDCYWALIDIKAIQPFSDFRPNISGSFIDSTQQRVDGGDLPSIYVYPKGDKFIMSDDYNLYYLYLKWDFKKIPCFILGEPKGKHVSDKTGPIPLPKIVAES